MNDARPGSVPLRADRLRAFTVHGEPLDLQCERGSVTVITGPSARETSAFLETLALLRTPAGGRVQLLGHGSDDDSVRGMTLRRKIGYVDVNSPLVSSLDVRMNVMLPLLYHHSARHDTARETADRLLDRFKYCGSRDESPARLSPLDNLRALFARAVALDPAVVFIDEPFRISVAASWAAIGAQIESLARDGSAIVVATRNISFAADSADQVVFIQDGNATAYAGWEEFERAAPPAGFIAALPFASRHAREA